MIEVRSAGVKGLGTFARERIKANTLVLKEAPFVPTLRNKSSILLSKKPQDDVSQLETNKDCIAHPTEAGSFFVDLAECREKLYATQKCREKVVELGYSIEEEHPLMEATRKAAQALASSSSIDTDGTNADVNIDRSASRETNEIMKILLAYATNSFDGGRMYQQGSRFNHACDANCVWDINPESEDLEIRTHQVVEDDEELTISYLGILRWVPATLRRTFLNESKGFTCDCPECRAPIDNLHRLPCVTCHPRGRLLPLELLENDTSVHYAVWNREEGQYACPYCDARFEATEDERQIGYRVLEIVAQKKADVCKLQEIAALCLRIFGKYHGLTHTTDLLFLAAQLKVLSSPEFVKYPLPDDVIMRANVCYAWSVEHNIQWAAQGIFGLYNQLIASGRGSSSAVSLPY